MSIEQSCRTCLYIVALPDRDGVVRLRVTKSYRCAAPCPPMPALPDSITKSTSFKWAGDDPRLRNYVNPEDGRGCPAWRKRA